ncbi:serine/arginine-rich SC35-like splicing factor SCL30A [Tanacetum coccineum]
MLNMSSTPFLTPTIAKPSSPSLTTTEDALFFQTEPRGFGFVRFLEPVDAAQAKYHMDGQVLQGQQLTVVFAEENCKKPSDIGGSGRFNDRRSPPPRYSHSPPPRYSQSPPPRYARLRSNSRESISPGEKRHSRERSYSRSPPARGHSPSPRSPVVHTGLHTTTGQGVQALCHQGNIAVVLSVFYGNVLSMNAFCTTVLVLRILKF